MLRSYPYAQCNRYRLFPIDIPIGMDLATPEKCGISFIQNHHFLPYFKLYFTFKAKEHFFTWVAS